MLAFSITKIAYLILQVTRTWDYHDWIIVNRTLKKNLDVMLRMNVCFKCDETSMKINCSKNFLNKIIFLLELSKKHPFIIYWNTKQLIKQKNNGFSCTAIFNAHYSVMLFRFSSNVFPLDVWVWNVIVLRSHIGVRCFFNFISFLCMFQSTKGFCFKAEFTCITPINTNFRVKWKMLAFTILNGCFPISSAFDVQRMC